MNDPTEQQSELDRLIGELLDRQDRGESVDEEALLRAHPEHAEGLRAFLEENARLNRVRNASSAAGGPLAEDRPGAEIAGRYKLLELIGEGGMGAVWLAQQQQPVKRKVAIKLIRAGMDSKLVLARFEAERQALALMEHPNIAQVFDGGVTERGRPFFVMEYIKGVPLTDYCDQARLSVRERLELFLPICRAVQHAHSKGIVHRDLKPSNIMVCLYDGRPVPKVIDFGLARALHHELTDRTLHTAHGVIVGTPIYMSPEQAEMNNLDVDTRTDVYSLGVVLYELLTGTTPLDREQLRRAAAQEVLRLVREEEVVRPSTRLSGSQRLPTIAAQRSIDPAVLQSLVSGDLDWIVLKALEKERNRRYESTAGLARDIERFLADQAIEARPPGIAYRLRKLLRRYRLPIAAAGVLTAGTLTAAGGVLWGWNKTREATGQLSRTAGELAAQQTATQQAEASLGQQLQALTDFTAIGIIRRIGLEAPAGVYGPLSPASRDALKKWARITDENQRIDILEQAISNENTAVQIARQFNAVLHACVGLSSSGRERVLELVRRKQRSKDSPKKVRAVSCVLAVALGDTEILALDDVHTLLPETGWTRRNFELQLWYLLPRLTAENRERALQFLTERATDPKSAANYLAVASPLVLERAVAGASEKLLKQLISDTGLAWSNEVNRFSVIQRAGNASTLLSPVINSLPEHALSRNREALNGLIKSCQFFVVQNYFNPKSNQQRRPSTRDEIISDYEGDESLFISFPKPAQKKPQVISSEDVELQVVENTLNAFKVLADRLSSEDRIHLANTLVKQVSEGFSPYELGLTPWALLHLLPKLPPRELMEIRRQVIEISLSSSKGSVFRNVISQMLSDTVVTPTPGEAQQLLNELAADPDSGVLRMKLAFSGKLLLRCVPVMDQQQLQQCWELSLTAFRESGVDHSSVNVFCDLFGALIVRLEQAAFFRAAKDITEIVVEERRSVSACLPLLTAIQARVADFTPEQHSALCDSLLAKLRQAASKKAEPTENFVELQHVVAAALAELLAQPREFAVDQVSRQLIEILEVESCPSEISEIAAKALNSLPTVVDKATALRMWNRVLQHSRGVRGDDGAIEWNVGRAHADARALRAIMRHVAADDVSAIWSALVASLNSSSSREKTSAYERNLQMQLAGPPLAGLCEKLDSAAAGNRLLQVFTTLSAAGNSANMETSDDDSTVAMFRDAAELLGSKLENSEAFNVAAWLSAEGQRINLPLRTLTWQKILPKLTADQVARCWDQLLVRLPPRTRLPVEELSLESLPLALLSARLGKADAVARWKILVREFTRADNKDLQGHLLPLVPILVVHVSPSEAQQLAAPLTNALRQNNAAIAGRAILPPVTPSNETIPPDPFLFTVSVSAAVESLAARLPTAARTSFVSSVMETLFELPDAAILRYPQVKFFGADDVEPCARFLARRDCPEPLRRQLLWQLDDVASRRERSLAASREENLKPSEATPGIHSLLSGGGSTSSESLGEQQMQSNSLSTPHTSLIPHKNSVFPFKHDHAKQIRTTFEAVNWLLSESEVRDVCK
jgi:serine/threonine protein kinase